MVKSWVLLFFSVASGFGLSSISWSAASLSREQLYKQFIAQGVPGPAARTVLDFLAVNASKSLEVTAKNRTLNVLERKQVPVAAHFAAIADYSLPSTEKRLYLLNLSTGKVQRFYMSHGHRSGVTTAISFSNQLDTHKSSLGLVLTGEIYFGFHKKSMALYGLEPSTNLVAERDIVLHGAEFASEAFLKQYGRLGRSWGCVTVERQFLNSITDSLGVGSVLYLYHPKLMEQTKSTPDNQTLSDGTGAGEEDITLPGEEEDLQRQRKLQDSHEDLKL
jgi:hypothetical protein